MGIVFNCRDRIRGALGITLLVLAAWGGSLPGPAQAGDRDEALVRQAMMTMFDKPHDPLKVNPVVVSGEHAVAGWVQGERGGRAVLLRDKGRWTITVCGGDGLKQAQALVQTGMTAKAAAALSQGLATAEAKLSPQVRAKFALFDGIVKVDANHGAPHSAKPAGGHAPGGTRHQP